MINENFSKYLIDCDCIKDYEYEKNIPECPGDKSGMRTTERLTLHFGNCRSLTIKSYCSGCAENSGLILD
jgi:hypothetical protein